MTISSTSGSSAYQGVYTRSSTSRNRTKPSGNGEDPLSSAISSLQSSDPELAKKLQSISDEANKLRESGASGKEVADAVFSALDGLSETEKQKVGEAMGPPPSGGPGGPRGAGGPMGPPPTLSSEETEDEDSTTSFDLSALLDQLGSMQNDAIASFMNARSTSSLATVQ